MAARASVVSDVAHGDREVRRQAHGPGREPDAHARPRRARRRLRRSPGLRARRGGRAASARAALLSRALRARRGQRAGCGGARRAAARRTHDAHRDRGSPGRERSRDARQPRADRVRPPAFPRGRHEARRAHGAGHRCGRGTAQRARRPGPWGSRRGAPGAAHRHDRCARARGKASTRSRRARGCDARARDAPGGARRPWNRPRERGGGAAAGGAGRDPRRRRTRARARVPPGTPATWACGGLAAQPTGRARCGARSARFRVRPGAGRRAARGADHG